MATQTVKALKKLAGGGLLHLRSQTQDDTYGIAGKSFSPYNLGFRKDGKVLINDELLAEFRKPVWGANKDQLFIDLIPEFPAKVPQYLNTPDGMYPWHPYDPNNPDTYPTENPTTTRGWECENDKGWYFQNMDYTSATVWGVLKIFRYRRQKMLQSEVPQIPNPEYTVIEAQRAEAGRQYIELLERENIRPAGTYQFQGLPLNEAGIEYLWEINGVRIEPDPNHKLAVLQSQSTIGTFKKIPELMRNPEIWSYNSSAGVITKDMYAAQIATKTYWTTWDLAKEAKLVFLTK